MNTITIELCAEDRARIDKLVDVLERRHQQAEKLLAVVAEETTPDPIQQALAEQLAKSTTPPSVSPENATGATEAETPTTGQPDNEPPAEVAPAPSVADLQQKVIALVNKGKKPAVQAIVNSYAATVTGIPEDKRAEAMQRMIALEG